MLLTRHGTDEYSCTLQFFFIALLPPIIFEAGYSLETKPCVPAPSHHPTLHTFYCTPPTSVVIYTANILRDTDYS